jgi:hypothetical protein
MNGRATAMATTWAAVLCRRLVTLAAPMLILMAGCKQEALCPALDSCGGPIVGDWHLAAGHPSCSEDVYAAPTDPRLVQADLPAARTPPPEPALYDWCDLLVTGPGDIVHQPPLFYTDGPNGYRGTTGVANYYVGGPIGAATIHYDANGTYTLSTTRTGTYHLDFPNYCMYAFGAKEQLVDPADPSQGTLNVCRQLQVGLRAIGLKKYLNIACKPSEQQGCGCDFDLSDTETNAGTYAPYGGNMQHIPGNSFPQQVTYCAQADRLQLTGADGAYLFDRVGLRTMDLVRFTPPPPAAP